LPERFKDELSATVAGGAPETVAEGNSPDSQYGDFGDGLNMSSSRRTPGFARTPSSIRTSSNLGLEPVSPITLAQSKWDMKRKLRKKRSGIADHGTELRTSLGEDMFTEDGADNDSMRFRVHEVLSLAAFDAAIGAVIVLNSIVIGLESQTELYGGNTITYQRMEHVFLFIYIVELALRFYAYGLACFRNSWVIFDLVVVTLGLFSTYIIDPVLDYAGANDEEDFFSMFLVLRIFRLAKIVRTVRLLSQFRALWMLVCGLLSSAGTMMYILVLLVIIIYVFACMGVELFTKNARLREDRVFDSYVERYWTDLPVSMLTLIQFVNLDGIGAIYTPMVRSEPWAGLFFVSFMLIVSICLMNLVTAVIVEGSFEQAKSDQIYAKKERQRAMAKLLPVVRDIFAQLDKDSSGKVTLEEFAEADESVRLALEKVCQTDDLVELFEMLDVDGSGSVEIEEFAEQLANFGTTDQPFINVRLMKQMELARREIKSIYSRVDTVQASVFQKLPSMDRRFDGVEESLNEIKTMIEGSGRNPIIMKGSLTAGTTPKAHPFSAA
jgi:voltage-gated sodium channel